MWSAFVGTSPSQGRWRHQDLTLALLRQAAENYAILTDSSKTAWHAGSVPFGLRRKLGDDFALVHIVRDPRGVCWSALKKAERKGSRANRALRCALAAFGWSVANLTCELFGWMYPSQYVRLRYEDLVRSPRKEVGALFSSITPDGSCSFEAMGAASNRHQLYGNRMRSGTPALGEISEDQGWRVEMPGWYRSLVEAVTWPLCGRFGYYRGFRGNKSA